MNEPPSLPPPPSGNLPPMPGAMPSWTTPAGPPAPAYASFWQRVGAILIDGLVLSPLVIPFVVAMMGRLQPEIDRVARYGGSIDMRSVTGSIIGWLIFSAAVQYTYSALMVRYFGGTLGKLALGIRVRRDDGAPAGWREALLRPVLQLVISFAAFVPGASLVSLLDDLWMLWDKQSQTLHDKVAGTIVVLK